MFNVQYIFRGRYLVTKNDENKINVYKHDICKFKEAFLVITSSKKNFWKISYVI